MIKNKIMAFVTLLVPLLSASVAFAVTGESGASVSKSASSAGGAGMSLIEWNPADLTQDRIRVDGEYIIIDGFAFGVASEFQRQMNDNWNHSTIGLGITATQYLTSQSMQGLFVKGELDLFGTSYDGKGEWRKESGTQAWMGVGADVGYRFLILGRLTGAASYGVRRNLPSFFSSSEKSTPNVMRDNIRAWDPRVQLCLGVSI